MTLTGGSLTISTQPFAFANTAVTGAAQSINASPGSAWSVTDGRGTGAAWTATISSTALVSAAGSVETNAQTIAVGQMSTVDGAVTAGSGADATTNITTSGVTLTGSAQTFIASLGTNRGSYTFTPTKVGSFRWFCALPCDTDNAGWDMTSDGNGNGQNNFMAGYISVTQ